MTAVLVALAGIFAQLSLLAFGGGNAVLPEMHRQVVEVHGWMTAQTFAALFALAQAAPGPNLMVATLVGWQIAGPAGAAVTTLGIVGPSSLLTLATVTVWERFREKRWRRVLQAALVPVTTGLVAASATLIALSADLDWQRALVTLAAAVVSLRTRLHPLWLLGTGALLGVAGLV